MPADHRKYTERLARITWDELRVRARQELAKRSDTVEFGWLRQRPKVSAEASGRFFFSSAELKSKVEFFLRQMPAAAEETVARAERICRHQFDLLGYGGVDYGPEIDWHLDAVSGTRAARKPWFKIHYLDYSKVGDAKVTWELSRQQHLVTLAKAYCFTGEDIFAKEIIRQWYSWREQNPYPIGVNWASSLEVAFRGLSWLWMLHLLGECRLASSKFRADVYQALTLSGRHIEAYLSTYFSPNTHLLGEGVALFFLGVLSSSASSERWKRRGWEIVLAEAKKQILPDGMHFEQSTYYHVYAVDLLLHARILAARNGVPIPREFDGVLEKMLDALCVLGRGGTVPRFGDDDGGRLFDPRRNRAEHLLDPLSTGAILFSRPDFKAAKPELMEETVWLLGADEASKFAALPNSQQPESVALRSSGIYLMNFPDKLASRLVIDAGPHGAEGGGHGHADALSVQLAVAGREVLIDPGTFVYAGPGSERQHFRGTASHNTLRIDEIDQAEPGGLFPWRQLPHVRVENWTKGDGFDFLVASHDGYTRLPDPVIHRRRVFGVKPQFWFVLDTLEGLGKHCAEVCWHLAPNLHWQLQENSAFAASEQGGVALLFADVPGSSFSIQEGWYSPVYGSRTKTEVLVRSCKENLWEGFATLVLPLAQATQNAGRLTRMRQDPATPGLRAYRYDNAAESDFFFFPESKPWRWRELLCDAEFLCYSIATSGRKRLIACGVSYMKVAGESTISASRPVERIEWSLDNGGSALCSSHENAIRAISSERLASLELWAAEEAAV